MVPNPVYNRDGASRNSPSTRSRVFGGASAHRVQIAHRKPDEVDGELSGCDFFLELFKLEWGQDGEAGTVTESHPERRWHEGRPIAGFEIFNEMVDEGFAFCVKCVLDVLLVS